MSTNPATEAEWPSCCEPERMFKAVQKEGNERKLSLVLIAAARLVWDLLPADELRDAVDACERRAEGLIEESAIDNYHRIFSEMQMQRTGLPELPEWAANPATSRAFELAYATTFTGGHLRSWHFFGTGSAWHDATGPHAQPMSDIIRCVFGNPFRPIPANPDWLTSTAVQLARGMYDSRDFSAMPILADALQDAGCGNADILDHCRGPGPHVRGCWVVDLVLGKT